ncbi:hypothetical protein JAAARDRAFT_57229 [Jaapia argillacea MUCL 33604]|uniref:Uncharacterized protein n=1 Tax=Jaapia argillacea MUCL 33604 TaxID=933084 RepID=A0A067PZK3_9AGAM|nr:hypothetical protein JAAARDRAFT_57229 [Jaapia argillacea MUCL 33604]
MVPALALVLPHPPLPGPRSSILSSVSSPRTPRTPLSCAPPPSSFFFPTAPGGNRKSSDSWTSWNSSNGGEMDDLEWEWKSDQLLMLTRTLDALPAHLLTPFDGVPPSNLLDKLARGVTKAKGSADWPHSVRATRAKIIELSRARAIEAKPHQRRKPIPVEGVPPRSESGVLMPSTTNTPPKRPLYRQSSMDFMQTEKLDQEGSDRINRLSTRLQRADRIMTNPAYHPYSRKAGRTTATATRGSYPPSVSLGSTPSSTTLNSDTSSHRHSLQRTFSMVSNSSDPYMASLQAAMRNPRVEGLRHSDSFTTTYSDMTNALKRAPSFGTASDSTKLSSCGPRERSGSVSSDDEEKARSRRAKKPRTKTTSPIPEPPMSPTPPTPTPETPSRVGTKRTRSDTDSSGKSESSSSRSKASSSNPRRPTVSQRPKANVQRNPSILGPELPHLRSQQNIQQIPVRQAPPPLARAPTLITSQPVLASPTPVTPPRPRTLRRMKVVDLRGHDAKSEKMARRISFGSLAAPAEGTVTPPVPAQDTRQGAAGLGLGLGSAFQLL